MPVFERRLTPLLRGFLPVKHGGGLVQEFHSPVAAPSGLAARALSRMPLHVGVSKAGKSQRALRVTSLLALLPYLSPVNKTGLPPCRYLRGRAAGLPLQPRIRRGDVVERAHDGGLNGQYDTFGGSPRD